MTLAASALIHAFAMTAGPPGPAGRERSPPTGEPPAIEARLIADGLRLPAAEAPLERADIAPLEPPRERVKRPAPPPAALAAARLSEGASIPDPTYYGVRQLDVYPALGGALDLRYPAQAAAAEVRGSVTLLVLIDERGTVNDVKVVDARPAGYFEEDALRVFRTVRFQPALKNGRAVRSRIVIELNYGGE